MKKKYQQVENFSEHTIRYLRKEATYANKCTREEGFELSKNNVRERLYFIYKFAKIQ